MKIKTFACAWPVYMIDPCVCMHACPNCVSCTRQPCFPVAPRLIKSSDAPETRNDEQRRERRQAKTSTNRPSHEALPSPQAPARRRQLLARPSVGKARYTFFLLRIFLPRPGTAEGTALLLNRFRQRLPCAGRNLAESAAAVQGVCRWSPP